MQANRVGSDGDAASVDSDDASVLNHRHSARGDGGFVMQHAPLLIPRLKAAIGSISAIREGLADRAQTQTLRNRQQRRAGQPKQHQRRINAANRGYNRFGKRLVARSHVVERTVRLHMPQLGALFLRNARERLDLRNDALVKFACGEQHLLTSEVFTVRKGWMRAYRDAVLEGEGDRFPH